MFIYEIRNKVNGKRFIGRTSKSVAEKWSEHVSGAFRGNSHNIFQRAIRKYGKDAFEITVLAETDSHAEADRLKAEYIENLDTLPPNGYNTAAGGKSSPRSQEYCRERSINDQARFHAYWEGESWNTAVPSIDWDKINKTLSAVGFKSSLPAAP